MDRRSLLKTTLPITASVFAGCSLPFQPPSPGASGIEWHMSFMESTPADRPLVVTGLDGEGPTNEVWGSLFTERPKTTVFTDRIEDESPYMKSQLTADRYDERFTVLVQMRFATPQRLHPATPHRMNRERPNRLRVLLESKPAENPSVDLQTTDSAIATTLLIYKYDWRTPDSVTLPVRGANGEVTAEIVAQ